MLLFVAQKYNIVNNNNENIINVLLKRFIKAGDDLHVNPQSEKTCQNNIEKVQYMREIMGKIRNVEKQLSR